MPYVRVETDVWLSPEEVGTAISKKDLDTLMRFVSAARKSVDLLFEQGSIDAAREPRPCPACGAHSIAEGYQRCLDDTAHHDCAHDVLATPCPMDAEFEAFE